MTDDMMDLEVVLNEDTGKYEFSTKNTREELLEDFKYFLKQARANPPESCSPRCLHQRFLRAAIFVLFA